MPISDISNKPTIYYKNNILQKAKSKYALLLLTDLFFNKLLPATSLYKVENSIKIYSIVL